MKEAKANHKKGYEIMAPVGSWDSLSAALQAGADSVYFGVGRLNMRARSAQGFDLDDMREITARCHDQGVKTYLTLNTVLYDEEIAEMRELVDAAADCGLDAIIASDIAVMEYARKQKMEVHISTQCNITNLEAVRFYARYADVMVLARELSLQQVWEITRRIQHEGITGPSGDLVQIELFVHGAFCMAVSGKCYLSQDYMNHSANRGSCLQLCRRSYIATDKEEGFEIEINHPYMMSPKDLCTIGFLDKIMDAGVRVFKIEGRGRGPDYVKTVVSCYREAADAVIDGSYSHEKREAWISRLAEVFNRGFWEGYYLGRSMPEWTKRYGSQASLKKVYAGKVTNFFSRISVAEIKLETRGLTRGDRLLVTGPTTGAEDFAVKEIRVDERVVEQAQKGDLCSLAVPAMLRRGDKVFVLSPVQERF